MNIPAVVCVGSLTGPIGRLVEPLALANFASGFVGGKVGEIVKAVGKAGLTVASRSVFRGVKYSLQMMGRAAAEMSSWNEVPNVLLIHHEEGSLCQILVALHP